MTGTATMSTIGRVHDLREQKRKRHNLEAYRLLSAPDLCKLRDSLRVIEALGLQPETPSAYIQLLINGRQ